jgi:DNA-binding MurR/RpiR family transcriptional regulator
MTGARPASNRKHHAQVGLAALGFAKLQDLFNNIDDADFSRAVDLLEAAETVYIAGQLRSAPVAIFMRYVLTMLRLRVVLLDADGGLATQMARVMRAKDLLWRSPSGFTQRRSSPSLKTRARTVFR